VSRKLGIIISLVMALVFTFIIINTANKKFEKVTKVVKVAQATEFIPIGKEINTTNTKEVEVVESAGKQLLTYDAVVGKKASVSIVKNQYLYKNSVGNFKLPRKGYVEVNIPVDLVTSANVSPGERVNIYITDPTIVTNTDKTQKDANSQLPYDYNQQSEQVPKLAPVALKNVLVLRVLDKQGENVVKTEGGITAISVSGRQPAAVGVEIPKEQAEKIIYAAANDEIYLAKISLEDQ